MRENLHRSVSLSALAVACGMVASWPAAAADVGPRSKAAPIVSAPAPRVINWTGFYFGGHVGSGHATFDGTFKGLSGDGDSVVFFDQLNPSGSLFGGHVGFNWDSGGFWAAGIEGDASWMNWKGGDTFSADSSESGTGKFDQLASIRGRLGIILDPERRGFLYATGGIAWPKASITAFQAARSVGPSQTLDFEDHGWVAGAGFEWAMTDQWRLRVEGLYYSFDDRKTFTLTETTTGDFASLDRVWTARVGVSYYFSSFGR